MTTQSKITLQIALAGWFLGLPSLGNAADPPNNGQLATRLDQMTNSIDGLKDDVAKLRASLEAITKRLDNFATDALQTQKNTSDVTDLRREIEKLRQDLSQLRAERPEARISQYQGPATPATPNYRIQLVNDWMEPMTVIIDGVSYRLLPRQTETITRTTPSFDYEVLGVTPLRRRSFSGDGRPFEIRIGP